MAGNKRVALVTGSAGGIGSALAMTRSLAPALDQKILVNAVVPGWIEGD